MYHVLKRRAEQAVSPVIAIILMVAISVVLAGVLYVWVLGMADTDADKMNLANFSAELSASHMNLTLHMKTGDTIYWDEHELWMDSIVLEFDDESTSVGEYLYVDIKDEYGFNLTVGNQFELLVTNFGNGKLLWENDVVCKG